MYSYAPGFGKIELVSYYQEFSKYYPICEPQTKAWFSSHIKPHWIIFDVGANIGYYTIQFSKLGHKVYAFEPTETVKMLKENLAHHRCHNVEIIKAPVGAKQETREDLVYQIWGNEPVKNLWKFITLDAFVQEHGIVKLDCIKIDVDSYDLDVLKGAKETIKTLKPFVVFEIVNKTLEKRQLTRKDVFEWLYDGLNVTQMFCLDAENFLFKSGSNLGRQSRFAPQKVTLAKHNNQLEVVWKNCAPFYFHPQNLTLAKLRNPLVRMLRSVLPKGGYYWLRKIYRR